MTSKFYLNLLAFFLYWNLCILSQSLHKWEMFLCATSWHQSRCFKVMSMVHDKHLIPQFGVEIMWKLFFHGFIGFAHECHAFKTWMMHLYIPRRTFLFYYKWCAKKKGYNLLKKNKMGKIIIKGATQVSAGHSLKLYFCMFEKSQRKHNSLDCHNNFCNIFH